jgi:hypothetical protein
MRSSSSWISAGVLVMATACTGTIGERPSSPGNRGGGTDPTPGDGTTPNTGPGPGPAPGPTTMPPASAPAVGGGRIRRLTQAQFENSLHDLLGPTGNAGVTLPDSDGASDAILPSVHATYAGLTDSTVDQYHTAMMKLFETYFGDANARKNAVDCVPASVDDTACLTKFVTGFGRRAWRRPLTATESDRYVKLGAGAAKTLADPWGSFVYAGTALLESPYFIYRIELGEPDPSAGGRFKYTAYETASRLSFLLTGTTPDVALLAAAETKQLDAPAGIRAQAARLLQSDKAKLGISNFAREYMDLDNFVGQGSGEPRYTESLRVAMRDEVIHLFEGRLVAGSDVLDILDTTRFYVTPELAKIYDLPGITGTAPVEVTLPAQVPRAGLLGTGAFLAKTSLAKMEEKTTSPTGRGVYINETILCRDIPPPPDGVKKLMPPDGTVLTKREYMEMHRQDPGCAACHALFDPVGFAFENFDWVGANRATDQGKPVDTTGTFEGFSYKNSKELVTYLKTLPDTQRCLVDHLFQYANGHKESASDSAVLDDWSKSFTRVKRNLPDFLTEMVASEGFRYTSPAPATVDGN